MFLFFVFVAVFGGYLNKLPAARLPIVEVLKRSVLAKGKEDWEVSSKNGVAWGPLELAF